MTSGNVSDEPIAYRDDDALERLAPIADARPRSTTARSRPAPTTRCCGSHAAGRCRCGARAAPSRACWRCPSPRRPPRARVRRRAQEHVLPRPRPPRLGLATTSATSRTPRRSASFEEGVAHFERLFAVDPGGRRARPAPRLPLDHVRARARGRRARRRPAPPRPPRRLPGRARRDRRRRSARSSTAPGSGTDGTVWGGEILVGDLRGFERAGHLWPVRAARRRPRPCASRGGWRARG